MILKHVVGLLEEEAWRVWAADVLHLKLPSNPFLNGPRQTCRVSRSFLFPVATSSRWKRNWSRYQLGMYLPAPTEDPKFNNMFSHITINLELDSSESIWYFTIAILFYSLSWSAFVFILQNCYCSSNHHICVPADGRVQWQITSTLGKDILHGLLPISFAWSGSHDLPDACHGLSRRGSHRMCSL